MSKTWIALIRAIGPATHKKMSMQHLRDGCSGAGLEDVRTLLATGNVLFSSGEKPTEIGKRLAGVIAAHGLGNEVFLRRPNELEAAVAANPFPEAAGTRPNHLLVLFLERKPAAAALADLGGYAGPERFAAGSKHLYIDYAEGVARSKLTPALLERRLKQKGTARNWNTVQKLIASARGS